MAQLTTGGSDYKVVTFDDAIERVVDERRERQDIEIPLKDFGISLDADGEKIVGTIGGRDYVPTMYCLTKMATIMDVSHTVLKQYLNPATKSRTKDKVKYDEVKYERDQVDRGLLVKLFKNGIREGRVDPEKVFKFRTYTDGTLRAMLSEQYAYIDNVWFINQLRDSFSQIGGDEPGFVHWRGNADTLYGNLLIPDSMRNDGDSDHGGMLSVSNCEIGKRRLNLTPAIFRSLCTNGLIFGMVELEKISKVHRGSVDHVALRAAIFEGITTAAPLLGGYIDKFLAMKDMDLVVRPTEMIAQIAQDFKLSAGSKGQAVATVAQYVEHENGNRNLFGIVNAITRAAQEYEPAEHVRLDEIGGELMGFSADRWSKFNDRAAGQTKKQVDRIYGRVSA